MEKTLQGLLWVNGKLQKLEKFCGSACLGVLFVVMITNAGLRYCFRSGLNWSDELNQFLFVWLGFIAAAYTMSTDKHLNVEAVVSTLPKSLQFYLKQLMHVVMIVFFALYIHPLIVLLDRLAISNVMRIPLRYVYLILPISFVLMIYHIICNIIIQTKDYIAARGEGRA